MLIAKVVGSVVATRKDEKLGSAKLLLCQVHDHHNQPKEQYVIAVDAVVMAVVDSWDLSGKNVYEKWS